MYLSLKKDAVGQEGIHQLQRILADFFGCFLLGISADSLGEYCAMPETSVMVSVKEFCTVLINSVRKECFR